MSDDLKNPGPEDGKFISLEEPHEVEYWTHALGVGVARLRQLVERYGRSAKAVRAGLAEEAGAPGD